MRWTIFFYLFVLIKICKATTRGPDGRLYEYITERIKTGAPPYEMKSVEYPSAAPHELVQSWRFAGYDTGKSFLKIVCNDISIPKNGNYCRYAFLSLEDGSTKKEWCGEVQPFTITAESNDVKLRFYSGKNGGGRIFCVIQAINSDGTTILPSSTEAPKPTTQPKPSPTVPGSIPNHFWFLESEEVDSSEHGGEEGEKATTCACGWANKITSRIVNGVETGRNEFPFAAALVTSDTKAQLCGATIVTEYHAITAAHCTEGSFKYNYSLGLIVGAHDLRDEIKPPAEYIDIEKIEQHSNYAGSPSFKHDLSLLILKSKITFGPHVGPACLPTHQVQLDRQYIKIVGWGDTYWRGPGSMFLKKVDVRVITMPECRFQYMYVDDVNPTQICTYARRGASCQGDSGGPVIWLDPETNRYTVVGAVSYGTNCGLKPTVHTAVGHYLDWIRHHINASKKSGQLCQKID